MSTNLEEVKFHYEQLCWLIERTDTVEQLILLKEVCAGFQFKEEDEDEVDTGFGTASHDGSGYADCDSENTGHRTCKEIADKSKWCSECVYLNPEKEEDVFCECDYPKFIIDDGIQSCSRCGKDDHYKCGVVADHSEDEEEEGEMTQHEAVEFSNIQDDWNDKKTEDEKIICVDCNRDFTDECDGRSSFDEIGKIQCEDCFLKEKEEPKLCWTCDEKVGTHKEFRDALGEEELTCDDCHRQEYPEQYEEEEEEEEQKCEKCNKKYKLMYNDILCAGCRCAKKDWWMAHNGRIEFVTATEKEVEEEGADEWGAIRHFVDKRESAVELTEEKDEEEKVEVIEIIVDGKKYYYDEKTRQLYNPETSEEEGFLPDYFRVEDEETKCEKCNEKGILMYNDILCVWCAKKD